jgi:predicted ATPase
VAIAGYRSLRDVKFPLGALTIVTGPNGSGKSSLYRSLRFLSDVAQSRLIKSLAREGGLNSTLWAGPERISREMRSGVTRVQGTMRKKPISLRLGFSGDDFGYAIDLGLPSPGAAFGFDPEIKTEAMWTGETLGRSNLFAERHGAVVKIRRAETGEWRGSLEPLLPFDSMVTHAADREDGFELLLMRERMRKWRFYDNLRTDTDAPARRPQIFTYTPSLANDGADIAAAIATIQSIGDRTAFRQAIEDAFPGSSVGVICDGDYGQVEMRQPGLLRPLRAAELSDGTLRYILLCCALLAPDKPTLMVLNEPEASLHPSLLDALGRLLRKAATTCQIVVVTHNDQLVAALKDCSLATTIQLTKDLSETSLLYDAEDGFRWVWPSR